MSTTCLPGKTTPQGTATPCGELPAPGCNQPSLLPAEEERSSPPALSSCPPLDPLQPVSANQSFSTFFQITRSSSQHERRREGTLRIRSHTTQVALTQTPDPRVGESAHPAKRPLRAHVASNRRNMYRSDLFLFFHPKMFPRKSVFNLWAIYNGNRPYKMYTNV